MRFDRSVIDMHFGVEEADFHKDEEKQAEEFLGDYDLMKIYDENVGEEE